MINIEYEMNLEMWFQKNWLVNIRKNYRSSMNITKLDKLFRYSIFNQYKESSENDR